MSAIADRSFEKGVPDAAPRRALPPFGDEHEELRESIRRFVANELRPHAQTWEDERWFPNEVFHKLAAVGYLGLKDPEEYGGQGGDHLHDAGLVEELPRAGSGGLGAGMGAPGGVATPPGWKVGTEGQKERVLGPALRGEENARARDPRPHARADRP